MADSKEDLTIKIKGDPKDFENALDEVEGGVDNFSSSLKISAKDIKRAFAVSFAGISAGAVLAFNKFKEFETGLVSVAKTTNLSGTELNDFKNNILNISESIPESTSQLLSIAAAAGQLGIKGSKNLSIFTETIAKLGKTTNLEGEEAALSIARLLTVTGESIQDVDKLGSVLVELGNNFAASEREIVRIASEVGKSTVNFKLRSSEVAGLSAALASLGVRAELGGSAIGRTFRAIDKTIRQGTGPAFDELKRLTGLTGDALIETFGDNAIEVFQKFIVGLDGIGKNGGDVTKELALFNLKGEELLKVLPTLASRSDLLGEALLKAGQASKSAAALNAEAAQAFDTTASKLQIAQNKLDALLISIGQELGPQVIEVLNQMNEIVLSNKDGFIILANSISFLLGIMGDSVKITQGLVGALSGLEIQRFNAAQANKLRELESTKFLEKEFQKREGNFRDFKKAELKVEKQAIDKSQQLAIDDKKAKAKIAKATAKELQKIENDKLKRLLKLNINRIALLKLEDEGAAEEVLQAKREEIGKLEELDVLKKKAEILRLKNQLTDIEREQLKHTDQLINIHEQRFVDLEAGFDDFIDGIKDNPIAIPIEFELTGSGGSSGADTSDLDQDKIARGNANCGARGLSYNPFGDFCCPSDAPYDASIGSCKSTGGGTDTGDTDTGGGGGDTDTTPPPTGTGTSDPSQICAERGLEYNPEIDQCCVEGTFYDGMGRCVERQFSQSTPNFSSVPSLSLPSNDFQSSESGQNLTPDSQASQTNTLLQSLSENGEIVIKIEMVGQAAELFTAQQLLNEKLGI